MENNVITQETIAGWMEILKAYHAGLAKTKARIVASENWWKLRNTAQERQETALGRDGGFVSRSGWLHNVIVSKHADAMEVSTMMNFTPWAFSVSVFRAAR